MAKALECPACGAKHRLDGLEPSTTFRCEQCGQTLKVPASLAAVRADADAVPNLASATPTATQSATSTVAPPPRRRTSNASATREIIGVSAALDPETAEDSTNGQETREKKRKRTRASSAPRRRVHWYWRVVAWLVAVPLGFVITAWPAYEFSLIKKDDVLDVFVGSGTGRYTRLAIGTLVWALVTALLVQLFIEGGRLWADRRRRERDAAKDAATTVPRARVTG
jgi:hypothetical protein